MLISLYIEIVPKYNFFLILTPNFAAFEHFSKFYFKIQKGKSFSQVELEFSKFIFWTQSVKFYFKYFETVYNLGRF